MVAHLELHEDRGQLVARCVAIVALSKLHETLFADALALALGVHTLPNAIRPDSKLSTRGLSGFPLEWLSGRPLD